MNNRKKAVNVDMSALLSLKAELYRKQAEMTKIKQSINSEIEEVGKEINNVNDKNKKSVEESTSEIYNSLSKRRHTKMPSVKNTSSETSSSQSKGSKKKRQKKEKQEADIRIEDSTLLQKSQRILQQKAKLYDQWSKSGRYLNCDDNCLVLFNKKSKEQNQKIENEVISDENDSFEDDDLVEFTDCLGRTRKCLRKELTDFLKQDQKLAAEMPKRLEQQNGANLHHVKTNASEHETNDINSYFKNTLSDDSSKSTQVIEEDNKSDCRDCPPTSKLEEQRMNWEKKMDENINKSSVHYQDVFFDEARQHGVGYYAFSTDEEERSRQQRELSKLHQETLEAQEARESMLERRQRFINQRVLAAKNRLRAREGLPPLQQEELPQKIDEDSAKVEEKMKDIETWRMELHEEYKKEMQRQQHIRPWDVEKLKNTETNNSDDRNDEFKYKPEREPMSQEQWLEYKRKERQEEFAPPKIYNES